MAAAEPAAIAGAAAGETRALLRSTTSPKMPEAPETSGAAPAAPTAGDVVASAKRIRDVDSAAEYIRGALYGGAGAGGGCRARATTSSRFGVNLLVNFR